MKVLMVGDIVGAPGRRAFGRLVPTLREQAGIGFVVANAENAAGGKGLTGALAEELLAAGADVLTLGDHAWDRKEAAAYLGTAERVIRPENFAPGCPGRGIVTLETGWGPVTVLNLIGRVFMNRYDCPFRAADAQLSARGGARGIVLVDFHAEATSEKVVMGRHLDGRVSCVAGTHTHVQTADETVLPGGTAYITDLGMTGPRGSALGRDLASVTGMFLTGMPARFAVGRGPAVLEGAIIEVERRSGRAVAIERVRRPVEEESPGGDGAPS